MKIVRGGRAGGRGDTNWLRKFDTWRKCAGIFIRKKEIEQCVQQQFFKSILLNLANLNIENEMKLE